MGTMLGWDQCSPSAKQDSQGNQCRDTCQEMEADGKVHYKCHGEAGIVDSGGQQRPRRKHWSSQLMTRCVLDHAWTGMGRWFALLSSGSGMRMRGKHAWLRPLAIVERQAGAGLSG